MLKPKTRTTALSSQRLLLLFAGLWLNSFIIVCNAYIIPSSLSDLKCRHGSPSSFKTLKKITVPAINFCNSPLKRKRTMQFWMNGLPISHTSSSSSLNLSSTTNSPDVDVYNYQDNKNNSLSKLYRIGTILFGILGFIILIIPDRTKTRKLATKLGGAGGFGIASGVSYILSTLGEDMDTSTNTNTHNDKKPLPITNDTRKRLNIGLLGFSLIGLFAVPGEAGYFFTSIPAIILSTITSTIKLFGIFLGYKGWKSAVVKTTTSAVASTTTSAANATTVIDAAGATGANTRTTTFSVTGWRQLLQDFIQGIKSTLWGLLKVKNKKKALTYRNCVFLTLLGTISSLMEGIMFFRYQKVFKKTFFDISLQLSAVSRLFLIMTIIYSLKDAAENGDQLNNSNYIQMNCMIGTWSLLVGIGQGIFPFGFSVQRIEMIAFSLPFLLKALKSIKQISDSEKVTTGIINSTPIDSNTKMEPTSPLMIGDNKNDETIIKDQQIQRHEDEKEDNDQTK